MFVPVGGEKEENYPLPKRPSSTRLHRILPGEVLSLVDASCSAGISVNFSFYAFNVLPR